MRCTGHPEKCEAEQCEADVKVRAKLLANTVVAEVWHRVMCQVEKVRLAAEKSQMAQEALWSPRKVQMRLGMSFFPFFFIGSRMRRVAGYCCASECGGRLVKMQGE